jgi:hypothetical protein
LLEPGGELFEADHPRRLGDVTPARRRLEGDANWDGRGGESHQYVSLKQAIERMKLVPLDGEGVLTARSLGISFGD